MDGRLAQYSAQMLGMKAATDNAQTLLGDLRQEYNKARRKMIDKKISEVFAGSALW
jgi:F-type H+-transporting ATPase subunit gamma